MGALVENCDTLFDIFVIGGHYRMAERKRVPHGKTKKKVSSHHLTVTRS